MCGTITAATAGAMSSLPLPYISSASATSAISRSPLSSCASSEGSISPQPRHVSPVAPAVVAQHVPVAAAAVMPKKKVENQEVGAAVAPVDNATAVNTPSLLDGPVSLQCSARIKVFLALPMDRFFIDKEDNIMAYSHSPHIPPTVWPSSYIMPSNYDILCGPSKSFFHHVGNRQFVL